MNPNELKKKNFTRAIRGYNTDEVDAYISSLVDKYEELLRENSELEYKLKASLERSEEAQAGEEELKKTIELAKKAADKIVSDAQAQADLLYSAAKDNTDRVLRTFRDSIASEAVVLQKLKAAVADMRSVIYKQYLKNIEQLEELAPRSKYEAELEDPSTAEYIRAVIDGMKSDVENLRTETKEQNVHDGNVTITRSAEISVAKKYRIASVRDTIRELNQKILSGDDSIDESIGEKVSGEEIVPENDDIRQKKRDMPKKKKNKQKELFNAEDE
ncbi:MAG: DivIVA domain-containing protein [Clostridia bacterium]|nr:DivIVA domain-containing protein [Clostridia bacterium]